MVERWSHQRTAFPTELAVCVHVHAATNSEDLSAATAGSSASGNASNDSPPKSLQIL